MIFAHPHLGNISVTYLTENTPALEALSFLKSQKILGTDSETTPLPEWKNDLKFGVDPYRANIRLWQFATPDKKAFVFDLFKLNEAVRRGIVEVLESESVKIFHNAVFDTKFARHRLGLKRLGKVFDTDIAERVLGEGRIPYNNRLADFVEKYLRFELEKEEQKGDWSQELTEDQIKYAALDAYVLIPLREALLDRIIRARMVNAAKTDFDVIDVIARMELSGFYLDPERWIRVDEQVKEKRMDIIDELNEMISEQIDQPTLFKGAPLGLVKVTKKKPTKEKLSITSPKIIMGVLEDMGIEVPQKRNRDGSYQKSTTSWLLAPFAKDYPLVERLLEFRELNKRKTSYGADYLNKYIHPITGRIHAKYDPLRATTSRFGNSTPNLQQIPSTEDYRNCFRPKNLDTHCFAINDYGQEELRIAAEWSQEPAYIDAFLSGADFHSATSIKIFGNDLKENRRVAKISNFLVLFGGGAQKLALQSGLPLEDCIQHIRNYHDSMPTLSNWLTSVGDKTVKYSRSWTWQGHVGRYYSSPEHDEYVKSLPKVYGKPRKSCDLPFGECPDCTKNSQARRNGPNHMVQGSGADILKRAMRIWHDASYDSDRELVHIVHDELIIECRKEDAEETSNLLKQCMEQAEGEFLKTVPVSVDTLLGDRWLKAIPKCSNPWCKNYKKKTETIYNPRGAMCILCKEVIKHK